MTAETKQSIISRYNKLLDEYFEAMTVPESNRINDKMSRIFWHEVCKPGYRFVWNDSNRIEDIVLRTA